ncbi:hypothetical protein TNCV_2840041 [Trichonephila clavipes]|uniref:Uncharacterized protein n=1 Tax=Trichonephila clavipes TaxID=2585209 RepID=A0A8X6RRJ1_TRICX|nr:hypothetical protein TNCV_2840041 [Trichonephila clavipes]
MSTKEREIKPSKRKTKKLKSSGRNANKTSDSDENQALVKEKNDLLRQIDFLNSNILDTKLKEPNKSTKTETALIGERNTSPFRSQRDITEVTDVSDLELMMHYDVPQPCGEYDGLLSQCDPCVIES